jgi:hypothetical protein
VGKPGGKRKLGRPKRRCVENIKIHLQEIEWCGVDWMVWFIIGAGEKYI